MSSRLTKAPTPVYLTKRGKNGEEDKEIEFLFEPLTDRDMDAIDEWLRAQYILAVRNSLRIDKSVTPEERREELQMAQESAASLSWMSGRGAKMMACPKGLARLIFQHCKSCGLEFEEVRELMLEPDNIAEVNKAMSLVNESQFKTERLKKLVAASEADSPGKRTKRKAPKRSKRKKQRKRK